MSEFQPGRIDLARRYHGWSKKEMARRCEVSPPYISQLTSGRMKEIPERAVQRIAFETGFPITFFILDSPKIDEQQLTYRKASRTRKSLSDGIEAEFEILSDVLRRVRDMCKIPDSSAWLDGLAPETAPQLTGIRRIASETRKLWGIPETGPIRNVMRSAERNGIVIVPMSTRTDQSVADGVTSPTIPDAIPLVGYFPEDKPGDRIRFTIAHEIGHLILHRKRIPSDRKMLEHEAHVFAGELLMPVDDVYESITPDFTLRDYAAIKAGWGISIAAAIRRAKDVGIINESKYQSLYVQLSQRHWLKHEPVAVEKEHPILFKQMVGRAFDGLDDYQYPSVSRTGVEGFLGVSYELLNTWCDRHLTLRQDSMFEL